MIYFLMADGFEEIEAIAPCDILRRAGFAVQFASIQSSLEVTGVHDIKIVCDVFAEEVKKENITLLVLPGGGKGTENLDRFPLLDDLLSYAISNNIPVAAICAAPSLLGKRGYLKGKKAVCYPGFEDYLIGAEISEAPVVTDGNIVTSKAAGTAIDLGLALVALMGGSEQAEKVKRAIYYNGLSPNFE